MKKLLLGLMLLVGLMGFSQTKILGIYNTGKACGAEALWTINHVEEAPHVYSIGLGLMGGDVNALYFIAAKDINKYFSVGGKVGSSSLDSLCDKDSRLYYGTVSYLQLTGNKEGLVLGLGYDNLRNYTFGLGYKF